MVAVTIEQLEALASEAEVEQPRQQQRYNGHAIDVEAFISRHGLDVDGPEPWNGKQGPGRRWTFNTCPMCSHGKDAFLIQHASGAPSAGCLHNSCKWWGWAELRAKFEPKANGHQQQRGQQDQSRSDDDYPDPVCLDEVEPPAIPIELFPGTLGAMVEAVATATETPIELSGLIGLGIVATCVQGKFSVNPEPGYFEPPNVFVAPAMESGNRKTAVLAALQRPLCEYEQEKAEALADEIAEAESLAKTRAARLTRLRSQYASEDSASQRAFLEQEIQQLEAEGRTPAPRTPRLFTSDATPEHLGTMLGEHDERMAIISDEGGIFDVMAGRYSNGVPNLDVYLQGHSGSFVRVDRGSRPPVILNHPALTIALSPQPQVLADLKAKPGFRARGLLARFLYAKPESKLGYRDLEPRPIHNDVADAYADMIRALLAMSGTYKTDTERTVPHVLRFDAEAYPVWKQHQRRVEEWMKDGGQLAGLRDWGSKLPGAVARIAGLFHCVLNYTSGPQYREIDPDTTTKAVALGEVLIPHALAVFDMMHGSPELDAARRVWQHIRDNGLQAFNFSELWHPLRGTFKRSEDIEPAVEILVERGLIIPSKSDNTRGRPGRRYIVNPKAVTP